MLAVPSAHCLATAKLSPRAAALRRATPPRAQDLRHYGPALIRMPLYLYGRQEAQKAGRRLQYPAFLSRPSASAALPTCLQHSPALPTMPPSYIMWGSQRTHACAHASGRHGMASSLLPSSRLIWTLFRLHLKRSTLLHPTPSLKRWPCCIHSVLATCLAAHGSSLLAACA